MINRRRFLKSLMIAGVATTVPISVAMPERSFAIRIRGAYGERAVTATASTFRDELAKFGDIPDRTINHFYGCMLDYLKSQEVPA